RKRGTSVYLPDVNYHMLPEKLAEETYSLCADALRPCISCLVRFDPSYQITSFDVVKSVIRVKEKLSYDQVDQYLESQTPPYDLLYSISSSLESDRLSRGAL